MERDGLWIQLLILPFHQAQTYDPDGEYVAHWLPELRGLPKGKRHSPGMSYIQPVVPLKFGSYNANKNRQPQRTRRRN